MVSETKKLIRYLIIGGLAAATHFSVAWLAIHARSGIAPFAAALGFSAGFSVSLVGHHSFTFKSNQKMHVVAPKMAVIAIFGISYNAILVQALLIIGIGTDLAILAGIATTPLANYILMRLWVFRV